jgi:large subunit ribosomal protein L19
MISEEIFAKLKSGSRVKVFEKGGSTFEGFILARKHGKEIGATITVRNTIAGVGVEKVYPIHSPAIDKVEVITSPKKIHRSKLYHLRTLSAKRTKQKLAVK